MLFSDSRIENGNNGNREPGGKICLYAMGFGRRRGGRETSGNLDNYIISGISVSLFLVDTRTLPLTRTCLDGFSCESRCGPI